MEQSGQFWKKCKERKHLTHEEFDRVEELEAFTAQYSNEIDECEHEIARIMNKNNGDQNDYPDQGKEDSLTPF